MIFLILRYMKTLFLAFLGGMLVFAIYHSLDIWWSFSKVGSSYGSFEILGRDNTVLTRIPEEDGFSLPYTWPLDTDLIKSIIQIEDRRFYSHHGIDIIGKWWALIENYRASGIVRWGSTLTEQYIKNQYFPGAPRSIIQKIKESIYAILLEFHSSKDTILRWYLDTVYMGNSLYGIETAKAIYFSGNIDQNARIEIITRIKYPNPSDGRDAYQKWISEKLGMPNEAFVIPKRERPQYINTYPHLTERIKREVFLRCSGRTNELEKFIQILPTTLCSTKSISLKTSIDTKLMILGKTMLNTTLEGLQEKNIHNGSIYVWSEKEKKVIIYLGNGDISRDNAVDMIVKKRSVWSTLKPFVYRLALRLGAHPDNYILDEKKIYETDAPEISYIAENYIPKSYGPVTLREALGNSLNSSTVRLSEHLGIGRIYEAYRSIGLDIEHDSGYYGYSISLGWVELTLENLIEWYRDLLDLSDAANFLIFDILSEDQNRARTFWVSSILNTSIPLAVKTGTSTDFRDNWTIWYDEDTIIWIWVWNVNRESMDDVSGISGAGPLYHQIAEALIYAGYITKTSRTPPENIIYDYICIDTSCLQKRWAYRKEDGAQKSDSIHQIYYLEDFITPLTSEEKVKWKIR